MNLRRIVTFTFVLAVAVLALGLLGCERIASLVLDDAAVMPPTDASPTMEGGIPIGVVVSLTGKDAEPYGLPMQRGFELARKELNMFSPVPFTFVTVDDQSSAAGAKVAVQQLVDQGLSTIIGIAVSTYLEEAFPIAQESGVVAFSSVSSKAGLSGEIGDFVFRAALATDIITPSGVMATHQKFGYEKVAVIYDAADAYSTSSNEEIEKALAANGIEILTTETFATGDTDFSEQLTSIMNMEPDALFISALAAEMPKIMVQAREIGIPDTVPFLVSELSNAEIQEAGAAAEGAAAFTSWSVLSNTPGNQDFVQKYQAEYGIEPEPWAAQSYAAFYILAEAFRNAQSTDATAIRDALAQTMDFPTILGNFSFDPNGEAMYTPVVLIVKDGALQAFE